MAPGAMRREIERMIPTAFSVATMVRGDHAQQPIMQPSRMQTACLRLLIIKAEQQKIPPFYANNKCNQSGNNHRLDYIADGYPEHVAEKNMIKMYVWFDCNIQDQTCGKGTVANSRW